MNTDNKKVINFTDAAVADSSFFFLLPFFWFSLSSLAWLGYVLPYEKELSPDQYSMRMFFRLLAVAAAAQMKNNFIPFVYAALVVNGTREYFVGSFFLFSLASSSSRRRRRRLRRRRPNKLF